MQKTLLLLLLSFLSALTAAPCLAASGYDLSDHWWNPSESGWGLGLDQQRDTLFATLYVYDAAQSPEWYVGALEFQGLTSQTREANYSGDIYRATGPWFGAARFDPALVVRRKVGTMQLQAPTMTSATLTYTIDGVSVIRNIERMTFRIDDYAGDYAATFTTTTTKCTNPADDGTRTTAGPMRIVQSTGSLAITYTAEGKACSYSGPYTQNGRLGSVFSAYTCVGAESGALLFEEMSVQRFGLMGRLFGTDSRGCHIEGRFAATRP